MTIPPARRRLARQGRYHLRDAYFRFYFRFLAPNQDVVPFEPERVLRAVQDGLRAFVGQTAFEDLAQQWVIQQGRAGLLPFRPEAVGSHWSRRVQIDVVGINWTERRILLGECKWGESVVGRQVIRDLINHKTSLVLRDLPDGGQGWQVHHAFFGRAGFTAAARAAATASGAVLVDLAELDMVLGFGVT